MINMWYHGLQCHFLVVVTYWEWWSQLNAVSLDPKRLPFAYFALYIWGVGLTKSHGHMTAPRLPPPPTPTHTHTRTQNFIPTPLVESGTTFIFVWKVEWSAWGQVHLYYWDSCDHVPCVPRFHQLLWGEGYIPGSQKDERNSCFSLQTCRGTPGLLLTGPF